MEVVTLLPLSQAEIKGRRVEFIDDAFAGKIRQPRHSIVGKELIDNVTTGGYPEVLTPSRQPPSGGMGERIYSGDR